MSDYDRLSAFLECFTYKPGWRFTAERGFNDILPYSRFEEAFLRVEHDCPDVRNPERIIPVGGRYIMPEYLLHPTAAYDTSRALAEWVVRIIKTIEMHEVDEWARIDGVPIKDPHPKLVAAPKLAM